MSFEMTVKKSARGTRGGGRATEMGGAPSRRCQAPCGKRRKKTRDALHAAVLSRRPDQGAH